MVIDTGSDQQAESGISWPHPSFSTIPRPTFIICQDPQPLSNAMMIDDRDSLVQEKHWCYRAHHILVIIDLFKEI